ncbi:hypothetical protein [Nocardioides alkalitolerans]|uniref:hypothetical protein n=1 Tax=Nocardioides alkalitolerans TaxID=281714 RepID=UPI0005BE506F|nr:hypothetical protein [Nocardioides alkalitolerans]
MNTPSRRSVLRAAAWSAPAVAVVAAAPAYAASTGTEAFELSTTRPSDGYAAITARNLSARNTISVSVTLPYESATARRTTYSRPRIWVRSGTGDPSWVMTVTLAPLSQSASPLGVGWDALNGDGGYDIIGTSPGLTSQAVRVPWSSGGIPG